MNSLFLNLYIVVSQHISIKVIKPRYQSISQKQHPVSRLLKLYRQLVDYVVCSYLPDVLIK